MESESFIVMDYLIIALKLIVGLSILNVWLVQYNKNTRWRGGNAATLKEEFDEYGMPSGSVYLVGFIKVALAVALIASIWFAGIGYYAALGLAFMLSGSILMHLKISDPLIKSLPAAIFLTMCLAIAFL
jgi:hypothetical protein